MKDSSQVTFAAAVLAHAVSIHAPGAASAQVAAAVEGCNQALGEERCVAAADPSDTSEWVATITWSDDEQRFARVELASAGETAERVTREVEFGADDPLEQRYRAVGLIVAAYVVATGSTAADATHSAALEPPPADDSAVVSEPPAVSPAVHESGWGLDGGLSFGMGFRGAEPVSGANLRPWWRPFAAPLLALGQLRWTRSDDGLRADWLSGSLGAAVRLEPWTLPLALEVRMEGVVQRVLLRAEAGERSERANLWRYGARAGADLVLTVSESWGFVLGGDASLLRPKLLVDVAGQPRGREAPLSVQGLVGLRFRRE